MEPSPLLGNKGEPSAGSSLPSECDDRLRSSGTLDWRDRRLERMASSCASAAKASSFSMVKDECVLVSAQGLKQSNGLGASNKGSDANGEVSHCT